MRRRAAVLSSSTETDPSSGSAQPSAAATTAPISAAERITSLDAIRGIATLGILPMNALAFGLEPAAYFNVSADGIRQPFDWVVGALTMIFVERKMMALFSLLFGVGICVFADRAKAKGRRVGLLSLWRFTLLFAIGYAHSRFWAGDILRLYALCAPIVLLARRLPAKLLLAAGTVTTLAGMVTAPLFQATTDDDITELGEIWFVGLGTISDSVMAWVMVEGPGRALGLMLIGVGLYRMGIVQGERDDAFYRRMAWWGMGTGTAITTSVIVFRVASDWSADYAITGHGLAGLGMIPMALGYLALIIMWNRRNASRNIGRIRTVGRMALTNYITQTVLGVVMLEMLLGDIEWSRTMIAGWILAVWALQVAWSTWWLGRFRYGPLEWAWRCLTYRRLQPLTR